MGCRKAIAVLGLLLAGSVSGYADSCQAGALSTVMGTVCTIGGLTFDFRGTADGSTGFHSSHSQYSPATGQQILGGTSDTDVQFVPVFSGAQAGFSLINTLGGSASQGGNEFNQFHFYYGVSTNDGSATILKVSSSGTLSSAGGFTPAGQYGGTGYASITAIGCNSYWNCTSSQTISFDGVLGSFESPLQSAAADLNWYGYTSFYTGAISYGAPASAFIYGGTVLYTAVPEPATLLLLASGVLGFALRRR